MKTDTLKPTNTPSQQTIGRTEFIILCATLICLVALSIDAMLPALQVIGADLGVTNNNDNQLIVTTLFAGLALGQMITGPLSDTIGRKRTIHYGLFLFLVGCVISVTSDSFEGMLVGRFLQGLGVSAPRIVTIAIVRDLYEGRGMAQIMSFVMAVFIVVPAIAPALGQAILLFAEWRMIFIALVAVAIIGFFWLSLRLPETLTEEKRLPFSAKQLWSGIKETCSNRIAFGYTVASGIIFGSFIGYLSSAQQIFDVVYDLEKEFPLLFAALALALGVASIVNGKLVVKYGMRRLLFIALIAQIFISSSFFIFAYIQDGTPALPALMTWGVAAFFCTGILFGNFNALAMEPMGHIAGPAAAAIGSISTIISLGIGFYIGYLFDGTVSPLVGGFALLSFLGLIVVLWTERRL